ncbi:3-deoxy-7-phosphoheptulonate synthase, partial [Streptomyces sp. NPDC047002]
MTTETRASLHGEAWSSLPAAQQPSYPDQEALRAVVAELEACPPLVFAG